MSRIIFVPPFRPDPPHSHSIAIGGMSVPTATTSSGPQVDPLDDYLNYYRHGNVSVWDMKSNFAFQLVDFSFSDVEDWVAKNCTLPVLSQPPPFQSTYGAFNPTLYFMDGYQRRQQFSRWSMSRLKLGHTFYVDLTPETETEINEWIAANLEGKYRWTQVNQKRGVIDIRDTTEATAFRMRWCESETPASLVDDDIPF